MSKTLLLVLLLKIITIYAGIEFCPKQMKIHNALDMNKTTNFKGDHLSLYNKIYIFSRFTIYLIIELNETSLTSEKLSMILAKYPIERGGNKKNKQENYAIKFHYSKFGEIKSTIKIRKYSNEDESYSNIKEYNRTIDNQDFKQINEIRTINYKIMYINNELTMYSENTMIYKEKIDLKTSFGDYAHIYLKLKSSKIIIKDFIICDSPQDITNLRNLENNEKFQLEVDKICIESSPNYLRSGNTHILPGVYMDLKDENGNLILNIGDKSIYNRNFLNNLVNVSHSKNSKFIKRVTTNKDNQIVVYLKTINSGELYLTSNYFKNIEKYIITVKNLEINTEKTQAEIFGNTEDVAGNIFKLKIILKDKYGSIIHDIEDSELEKFEVKIILPDNSTINCNKGLFDNNEKILIFKNNITIAGESMFDVKYNNENIKCNNCKVKVIPNEMKINNIIINYIHNESRIELNENITNVINKDNNLTYEILFYDEYNNRINDKIIYGLNTKFIGLESQIDLCQDNKASSKIIYLCDNYNNNKNWYYLVNGEYSLEVEYLSKTKKYYIEIKGEFEDGSNGKLDINNTILSTNEIMEISGENKIISIELRTNDDKRKNYWYDEPYNEIEISFKNNDNCSRNITRGDEPGKYNISFICLNIIGESLISLKIEGEELQKKISLLIVPNDVKFFSLNDSFIDNNKLPLGNADNPYIIKLQLFDINNNTINCPNIFNYQFSNSNSVLSDFDCDLNQIIYINKSFIISDEYLFIIPIINKTYSFNITHGEPVFDINYTEQIETGEKANLTLSLDIKDKYNNSIPIEDIINNINITFTNKTENNYNIISYIDELNKLMKFSNKDIITKSGSYFWTIYYNGKKINDSIELITKAIPIIDLYNIKLIVNNNIIITNNSNIGGNDSSLDIAFIPRDSYGNEMSTSNLNNITVGGAIYLNNSNETTSYIQCNSYGCQALVPMRKNYRINIRFKLNDIVVDYYFTYSKSK